ncbi:hypothetical protein [Pseudomonas juntendi]|uniref:hypothetical protein n=1 Tax=Pseudomonas juntendi TaxID=2666183 RepID=UPI0034533622
MPTENRSSNTEMVSVPREAVVQAAELLQEYNKCSIARDLRAILAQPAEQHQGEPAALAIPDECPHIIVFDDADRANEHFCGAGARTAALRRYEQISQSWNAHLFVRIARNSRDDRYPSAAVADPGEVERLSEQLVESQECHEAIGMRSEVLASALNEQEAELKKARSLLRESYAELLAIKAEIGFRGATIALIGRIDAALSTSAEPSALPDPLGCNECTHAECGKFDGPRQLECRAMADNACARPGASS